MSYTSISSEISGDDLTPPLTIAQTQRGAATCPRSHSSWQQIRENSSLLTPVGLLLLYKLPRGGPRVNARVREDTCVCVYSGGYTCAYTRACVACAYKEPHRRLPSMENSPPFCFVQTSHNFYGSHPIAEVAPRVSNLEQVAY